MKKMKTASLLIVSIMVFSVFLGCNKTPEGTSPLASEPMLSAPELQTPSKTLSSSPFSAALSSSGTSSTASFGPDDRTTSLKNIVTSNKEFNKLFVNNLIDKAYLVEMEKATSTAGMIKASEKYTRLWQAEIDSSYKKLLAEAPDSKKKSYQNHQEKWVEDTPDDLKKITEKV